MNVLRCAVVIAIAVTLAPACSMAQFYGQPTYHSGPIVSQPMIVVSPQPVTRDPFDACKCGCPPGSPGDCKCKHLDCKIRLSTNCKATKPLKITPINCRVCGKIPKREYSENCLKKICDFYYDTEVPEIHCAIETCTEIGKKSLECLPGCCFSVCVPVKECTTEKVECKLVLKRMPMQLWKRKDEGRDVFDVYVINDCDENSEFFAGGMPEKWLVIHCGSKQDIMHRFPGALCADGSPMVISKKGTKPKATPADVDIELVLDEKKVEEFVKQAAEKIEKETAETTTEESTENG